MGISKRLLCVGLVCLVGGWGARVGAQDTADAGDLALVDAVQQIGLADQLAAYGYGELNAEAPTKLRSPWALVTAGGILLRVDQQLQGKQGSTAATVTDDSGQVVAAETPPTLKQRAEELFDAARALATEANKASLEEQIKLAMHPSVDEGRGNVGGPQVIQRRVRSGGTHSIELKFEPNQPAVVTMRGNGVAQFEIVGPGGKVLWHSRGTWGTFTWVPGKSSGPRNVTVKIINGAGDAVNYTLTTN